MANMLTCSEQGSYIIRRQISTIESTNKPYCSTVLFRRITSIHQSSIVHSLVDELKRTNKCYCCVGIYIFGALTTSLVLKIVLVS